MPLSSINHDDWLEKENHVFADLSQIPDHEIRLLVTNLSAFLSVRMSGRRRTAACVSASTAVTHINAVILGSASTHLDVRRDNLEPRAPRPTACVPSPRFTHPPGFRESPRVRPLGTLQDWVDSQDRASGRRIPRARSDGRGAYPIHYHVWTPREVLEMLTWAGAELATYKHTHKKVG